MKSRKMIAENPPVRFAKEKVALAATPRRGSLLYKKFAMMIGAAAITVGAILPLAAFGDCPARAVWAGATGGIVTASDMASPSKWTCYDASGNVLADVVPGRTTTVEFDTGSGSVFADSAGFFGGSGKADGCFIKKGTGNLILDFIPPSDTVQVDDGMIIVRKEHPTLAHRWSFNGNLDDSVTGTAATFIGSSNYTYAVSSSQVVLPGGSRGTSGLDLGPGKLPSDSVTIECWVTPQTGNANWSKVFDVGKKEKEELVFSFANGSGDSCIGVHNGTPWDRGWLMNNTTGTGAMPAGTQYYVAVTLTPDGKGGTRVTALCFNAATGELIASGIDNVVSEWTVDCLDQTNFYLGHTVWGNNDAAAAYNEFRIWDGVFTKSELAAHAILGPDALPGESKNLGNVLARTKPELAHRWSFNGNLYDSVVDGGGNASFTGTGTLAYNDDVSPSEVVLPGGTRGTSGLDLGSGLLPSDGVTIECWVTPQSGNASWSKVFDVGVMNGHELVFTFSNDSGQSCLGVHNNSSKWLMNNTTGTGEMSAETKYYVAVTLTPDGRGNTRVRAWCRNASTGELIADGIDSTIAWSLHLLNQSNFYLGHTVWGNNDAAASYDEFRIWNGVFSPEEIAAHAVLGPDTLPSGDSASAYSPYASDDEQRLLHRWTFNSVTKDLVGTNNAVFNGSVAFNNTGTAASLPGGDHATSWIDLGSSILPMSLGETPFTIETWTTLKSTTVDWTQLFTFGNENGSTGLTGIMFGYRNSWGETFYNPIQSSTSNIKISSTALSKDVEYHISLSVMPAGDGKGASLVWYIFKPDGTLFAEKSGTFTDWSPNTIVQDHFWLGRTFWSDKDATAEINEVRVWGAALSKEQLRVNGTLGPDVLPASLATAAGDVSRAIPTRRRYVESLDALGNTVLTKKFSGLMIIFK